MYSTLRPGEFCKRKPTLADVATAGGFRGLYRGYGATLLSFGPFSAIFFTLNHVSLSQQSKCINKHKWKRTGDRKFKSLFLGMSEWGENSGFLIPNSVVFIRFATFSPQCRAFFVPVSLSLLCCINFCSAAIRKDCKQPKRL